MLIDTTRGSMPRVLDWHSAPWGVVSLTEHAGGGEGEGGRLAAYERMRGIVADSFADFAGRLPKNVRRPRLLGTSGTVTTLGSVHLGLSHYDRAQVDGLIVPPMRCADQRRPVAQIGEGSARSSPASDRNAPTWWSQAARSSKRSSIVARGRLGIADRGIREGILRRLMGSPRP